MKKTFNPLSFLQSLGSGGLAVTFFMYLMFMTKHDTPIPTFDTLLPYFTNGNIWEILLIIVSALGIIVFGVLHIVYLMKHLKSFFQFKKTPEYQKLLGSNAEITLITLPLTLAMTMNVLFMAIAVFAPKFWNIIEYAFPIAIFCFVLIGIYALRIYGVYFTKRIQQGGLDVDANNSLSQMISAFAFAMVGVGLAGPAAMSQVIGTSVVAMFFSILFLVITFVLLLIKLIIGFQAMFSKGINKSASPSLRIMIPILTLFGISLVRHNFALEHGFGLHVEGMNFFILTTIIFSLQLFFGYLGYLVMKKNQYFKEYVAGEKTDVGTFALICPGVALMVFGMFFLNIGLVYSGILPKFSVLYFILLAPLVFIQIKTIFVLFKLNKKLAK